MKTRGQSLVEYSLLVLVILLVVVALVAFPGQWTATSLQRVTAEFPR